MLTTASHMEKNVCLFTFDSLWEWVRDTNLCLYSFLWQGVATVYSNFLIIIGDSRFYPKLFSINPIPFFGPHWGGGVFKHWDKCTLQWGEALPPYLKNTHTILKGLWSGLTQKGWGPFPGNPGCMLRWGSGYWEEHYTIFILFCIFNHVFYLYRGQ